MSLPAGPMISLTSALEGVCTLWPRDGEPREVSVVDFVTGNHQNVLQPGELLRSIHLPAAALAKRAAFRQASLTKFGRSAVLIIGTVGDHGVRSPADHHRGHAAPVQLRFAECPSAEELRDAIDARLSPDAYFDDVHGSPPYRRHLTHISPKKSAGS